MRQPPENSLIGRDKSLSLKPRPCQYSGCPRRRRSRFNHVQALVNFGKFIAGRGLQPLQKFGALTVSRKQKIQYRDVNIPHFLLNKTTR